MTSRNAIHIPLCAAAILSAASAASAQDSLSDSDIARTPEETPDSAPSESALPEAGSSGPQFSLDLRSRLTFRSDVRGTDADAQVSHSGVALGVRHQLSDRLTLVTDFGFEYSYYDFGGGALVDGVSDPFDDLYSLGGFVTLSYAMDEQWSVFGAAYLGFAGEAGADVGDSILGGGGAGVAWHPSDWFHISFGLAVRSRLEDNAIVSPLINFHWRLSETLRLETRNLPQGGGIGLTWEVNDTTDVTLFGGVEYRQWRLDGGQGELSDGVIRDLRVPLGAAVFWRLAPTFTLEVEGGAIVYQEYEFLDRSGDRIEDLESDLAPFIGVRLQWTF